MCIEDIHVGFVIGNYGNYIQVFDIYQHPINIRLLLTWKQVLNGCLSGIQVWRQEEVYRDVSSNYHNARQNTDNMNKLLGQLYEEIYGDRLQFFSCCLCLLLNFTDTIKVV